MQTILGTLSYYEKHLGPDNQQKFRDLNSAIRKYLMPGWGFPQSLFRATKVEIENAQYALNNLPIERMYDWKVALEKGFDLANKDPKKRTAPRSHVKKFVDWCFSNKILLDPKDVNKKHKATPARYIKADEQPKIRRRKIETSKFSLVRKELLSSQIKLLAEYARFLEASYYPGRGRKKVRESTSTIRQKTILKIWGWMHSDLGVPLENLNFDSIIRAVDLVNALDTAAASSEFEDWFNAYAEFLRNRGNAYSTIASDLASLTRFCQFQHRGKYVDKHGNDIPVMRVIRDLIEYYEDLAKDELEPIPIELRWLDLPDVIRNITLPLFAHTEYKSQHNYERTQSAIASSFIDALIWAFLTLMAPRRSGEWRTARLALACDINGKPTDLQQGEWVWPLPANRWSEDEVKYGYLTRQYVYQDPVTLERFGSYLGTVPPSDRYLERVCLWFKDTPPQAAKTGYTHKYQQVLIMDRQVYQGKNLYEFLEAYLMGYWRDSAGNWISVGKTLEAPSPDFERYDLRSAIAKDSLLDDQLSGWFIVGRDSGNIIRSGDFSTRFTRAANKMAIASKIGTRYLNPHLMRSIYAVHMIDSGASLAVLKSLATAMGHTLETLERIYDKRRPTQKTRLIELDLTKRLDRICAGLPVNPPENSPYLPSSRKDYS